MRARLAAVSLTLGAGLLAASMLASAASAFHRPFTATLIGANEVPVPGSPLGFGSAAVHIEFDQGMVCYALSVSQLSPPATAAHIHQGPAGVEGPIVVPFDAPVDGTANGCVEGVNQDLLQAINASPSEFYVNVHNAEFPRGAIRGQLQ